MKETKNPKSKSLWRFYKSYPKLVRYHPSGTLYARFRLNGKLHWKSLKTDKLTYADERLHDLLSKERKRLERGQVALKGKILFGQAAQSYKENGFRPVKPRNQKDAKPLKPAALAYYQQRLDALLKSWSNLAETDIAKITEGNCETWAKQARATMSGSAFNHTLTVLRNILDYGVHAGARYENPAIGIMRASETAKKLTLPTSEQFTAFIKELENGGSRDSRNCADLVRFLAFGGFRKGEAAYITWADCDFDKGQITVRGHPITGLKNRRPGEFRVVPMVPDMRTLLLRLKTERPGEAPTDFVMKVRECQKSMDRAAREIGMERITHHDCRHWYATRCIESGVDIPTVSSWLGHSDGGALAMRIYKHLRNEHSIAMAQKVTFGAPDEPAKPIAAEGQKIVPFPQAATA